MCYLLKHTVGGLIHSYDDKLDINSIETCEQMLQKIYVAQKCKTTTKPMLLTA